MECLDLLNLIVTAHKDTRLVVNMLRYNFQHPIHVAIDGLPTSCNTRISKSLLEI